MQYSNVLLLSKDNLLRNTLQARISNLFSCNILEGANPAMPGIKNIRHCSLWMVRWKLTSELLFINDHWFQSLFSWMFRSKGHPHKTPSRSPIQFYPVIPGPILNPKWSISALFRVNTTRFKSNKTQNERIHKLRAPFFANSALFPDRTKKWFSEIAHFSPRLAKKGYFEISQNVLWSHPQKKDHYLLSPMEPWRIFAPWNRGTHFDAGTGPDDAAAGPSAGPVASCMPSRPSSIIDASQIRKNRNTPLGEYIQISREIAGTDAIIRSAAISGANWRAISSMVQQSRRTRFTRTNAIRSGPMMEKSQSDPGSCL